jgi:hypothetical protein
MAEAVIGAIDQLAANALLAHVANVIFWRGTGSDTVRP